MSTDNVAQIAFAPLDTGGSERVAHGDTDPEAAQIYELASSVINLMRSLEAMRSRFAREAQISDTGIQALAFIAEAVAIAPKQLAELLRLTTGSVTYVVDQLEKSGLIRRIPNPADRRSVHLALTGEGLECMSAMYRAFQMSLLDTFSSRSSEEINAEIDTLTEMSVGLDRVMLADRVATR